MDVSVNFKQALYSQPNSVVEEFYERAVGLIFEKDEDDVRIEVRCWSNSTLSGYERDGEGSLKQTQSTTASALNTPHESTRVSYADDDRSTEASRPIPSDGDIAIKDPQVLPCHSSSLIAPDSDPDNIVDLDVDRLVAFVHVRLKHSVW